MKKRIKKGDVLVVKKDKSGKLVLMKQEDYIKIGIKDNESDKRLNRKVIKDIQKMMNDHTRMLSKAFHIGENHGHLSRVIKSKVSKI